MPEEKATPDEGMQGTTSKLFPEFEPQNENKPQEEVKEKETPKEVPKEEKVEVSQAPEPKEVEKTPSDYLSIEDVGKKKLKTKIDGVEGEVTVEEAIRNFQTWQHLTKKGQQIGEEARKIQAEKEAIEKYKSLPKEEPKPDEFYEFVEPHVKPLNEKISKLQQENLQLMEALKPVIYQSNIDKADGMLKKEGFGDYKEYLPKITEFITTNVAPELWDVMDTVEGSIQVYKILKLDEYKSKLAEPKEPPKELPKIDERPKPRVVQIESSGSPTGATDGEISYQKAFEKAKQTGDWTEVLNIKGVL